MKLKLSNMNNTVRDIMNVRNRKDMKNNLKNNIMNPRNVNRYDIRRNPNRNPKPRLNKTNPRNR